jgi:hypothetical protein
MTHLKPEQIVDTAEGHGSPEERRHLETCTRCREQVRDLAAVLADVKRVPANEPSPLFWDHLSANIREGIGEQPPPGRSRAWVWAPAAVAVALAVGIGVSNVRESLDGSAMSSSRAAASQSAAPQQVAIQDKTWGVVSQASEQLGWDEAEAAGLAVPPGAADYAAGELSDDQQEELARLLEQELARLKS